jgi:cellulose biosynthesis protein BcsQ
MLGAELALRGHCVAVIDRDLGQHLSRVFDFYPRRSTAWCWARIARGHPNRRHGT